VKEAAMAMAAMICIPSRFFDRYRSAFGTPSIAAGWSFHFRQTQEPWPPPIVNATIEELSKSINI
jgi:hypothetical protein